MTDRERLEAIAREKAERQASAAAEAQQREAALKQARASVAAAEKQKTDELRALCEATFKGFKLIPTGHEVNIGTTTVSRLHNIQNDGGEWVTLLISHWGEETGECQGSFPILMARYKNGYYEYVVGVGSRRGHPDNLDEFKELMMQVVGGTGVADLRPIFAAVRRMMGR